MSHFRFKMSFFIAVLFLVSCQTITPPVQEYTIARTAMDAAKGHKAPTLSAGNWQQALDAYRKAQVFYKDQNYEEARAQFIRARFFAERAENAARLLKMRNGEF